MSVCVQSDTFGFFYPTDENYDYYPNFLGKTILLSIYFLKIYVKQVEGPIPSYKILLSAFHFIFRDQLAIMYKIELTNI